MRVATIGSQRMIFEEPDTVVLAFEGTVSGDETAAMMQKLAEWSRDLPFVLILADLSPIASLSPKARRMLTVYEVALPPRAIALYGGSFTMRMAVGMMVRASDLLTRGRRRDRWIQHAEDEAAARAWLVDIRDKLARGV